MDTPRVAEALINWIYIWGHWPVIVATMIWLAWRHRRVFLRLRDGMLVSGAIGLIVFASYPVAPPRLADGDVVDTVTRSSDSYRVLQPPAFVNQYAAMPSLHSGWDLLVGIAIVTAATTVWLRVVGVLLPASMLLAVVATGNHFVLDVVAGVRSLSSGTLSRSASSGGGTRAPGRHHEHPGHRSPGRELAGRAARGQRARRRRRSSATCTSSVAASRSVT